jgi:hypothetical protein
VVAARTLRASSNAPRITASRCKATFENEWYLAREVEGKYLPFDLHDHAPVYSSIGHDLNNDPR